METDFFKSHPDLIELPNEFDKLPNNPSIVFLDIDGVLNHHEYYDRFTLEEYRSLPESEQDLDPVAIEKLNRLTGIFIIISSSWRYCKRTVDYLKHNGLIHPIIGGLVKRSPGLQRGKDIEATIKVIEDLKGKINYVIFDDDNDMLPEQNFIQTNYEIGLSDDNIIEAKRILNIE